MLTEKEFFNQLKDKGYSKARMNNPFLNQMRSDRTWIVDKKTKQTIGHYMDSHYCGRGDFTIYETPIEAKEPVIKKPNIEVVGLPDYKYNPVSLETIGEYVQAIFDRKTK